MGIRFLCPNGHKLNVKAFLAGERGICPQCDAKFLVPSESSGQVEAISEATDEPPPPATEQAPNPAVEVQPVPAPVVAAPPPPPAPALPPNEPEPEVTAPPEVWYVRTATGEQYGPAHVELMREWVADGRVTVDCFVWRTGWEDWRSGGKAITFLNVVPPEVTTQEPPNSTAAEQPPAAVANNAIEPGAVPEPTSPTAAYHSKKRVRQDRARKLTLLLGVVVLLLFAVLIAVLINNK